MSVLKSFQWLRWLMAKVRAEEVVEEAHGRLRTRPHLSLKHVSCAYHDGVLTLRGIAATESLRDIAGALARRVEGVVRVHNDIEVEAAAVELAAQRTACGSQGPHRWRQT